MFITDTVLKDTEAPVFLFENAQKCRKIDVEAVFWG
jgi:hypothetical protein